MKVIIQRVKSAEVTINNTTVRKINKGLVILFGVGINSTESKIKKLAKKISDLRIFEDQTGKMNYSNIDTSGEILIISQFTLYANCSKGRRPDYFQSAKHDIAISFYEKFIIEMKKLNKKVETGEFGAYMQVNLINDGPVTILLDESEIN